ncbi:MAG: ABC transporter ATP-binding protein [Candidatus Bathyarchaeia archaeon]
MPVPLFLLENVTFSFHSKKGEIKALNRVNLKVYEGEFLSIVGPSGCGKTTLLRLISGLLLPKEGGVFFKGERIYKPLKAVGFAFQDPLLLLWRTVIDNILLPIEVMKLAKQKYIEKAYELMKVVGLTGFEKRNPWELSGGMKQRVNLCRALIHDPIVLLLDEPFGALDAFTREELWLMIQRLTDKQQCTTILVTHDLREAIFLSDRVIVLSCRPGTVIHEEKILIPKPRTLKITYSENFIKHQLNLREMIGKEEFQSYEK